MACIMKLESDPTATLLVDDGAGEDEEESNVGDVCKQIGIKVAMKANLIQLFLSLNIDAGLTRLLEKDFKMKMLLEKKLSDMVK